FVCSAMLSFWRDVHAVCPFCDVSINNKPCRWSLHREQGEETITVQRVHNMRSLGSSSNDLDSRQQFIDLDTESRSNACCQVKGDASRPSFAVGDFGLMHTDQVG